MPIPGGGHYAMKKIKGGYVRLHFGTGGAVNEAKNMQTGKVHTPAEFAADAKKMPKMPMGKTMPMGKKMSAGAMANTTKRPRTLLSR